MLAGIGDQSQVEGQVVYAGYLQGQQLLSLEQVVQVGLGVQSVDVASVGVNGREVGFPLLVAQVHRAVVGEQHGVAAVASGHDAVEHVDAALYAFEYVLRCAHAHEVARTVLGQYLVDHLYHLVHHLRRLSHSQASDGVTLGTLVGHEFCRFLPQVLVLAALHNGKQCLVVAVEGLRLVESLQAAVQPAVGEPQRLLGIQVVALARGTFVEGHHDVGADDALRVHHVLGCEEVLAAVYVAAKFATFLAQLADASQ